MKCACHLWQFGSPFGLFRWWGNADVHWKWWLTDDISTNHDTVSFGFKDIDDVIFFKFPDVSATVWFDFQYSVSYWWSQHFWIPSLSCGQNNNVIQTLNQYFHLQILYCSHRCHTYRYTKSVFKVEQNTIMWNNLLFYYLFYRVLIGCLLIFLFVLDVCILLRWCKTFHVLISSCLLRYPVWHICICLCH